MVVVRERKAKRGTTKAHIPKMVCVSPFAHLPLFVPICPIVRYILDPRQARGIQNYPRIVDFGFRPCCTASPCTSAVEDVCTLDRLTWMDQVFVIDTSIADILTAPVDDSNLILCLIRVFFRCGGGAEYCS